MNRILKLILCIIVCSICILPGLQVYAGVFDETANVRAEYDSRTGTLTLEASTSTDMKDFPLGQHGSWKVDEVKNVIIKDGITHIGDNTFSGFTSLETVEIQGSTKLTIGRRAFYGCRNLKNITFSEGTTEIGAYAFARCSSLTAVDLSATSVTKLGQYAFGEDYSITSMKLSSYVERIEDYSFYGCNRMTNIDLPDTLSYVGDCAFLGCSALAYAVLSDKLTYLGDFAFRGCKNLKYIVLMKRPEGNQMGSGLFTDGNPVTTYIYAMESVYNIYNPGDDENVTIKKAYKLDAANVAISVAADKLYYTGAELTPQVSVTDNGGAKVNPEAYEISYKNNVNAGTATVVVTGKNEYVGTMTKEFTINKATCKLTVNRGSKPAESKYVMILKSGKKTQITLKASTTGNEKIRFVSGDEKIASVSANGVITAKKTGTTKIYVVANNKTKSNYDRACKTIVINVRYGQTITVPKSSVTYDYSKNMQRSVRAKVKDQKNVKVKYKSSNRSVLTVSTDGKITVRGIGKATLTITAKDNGTYAEKTRKVEYTIRPVMGNVTIAHNSKQLKITVQGATPDSTVKVALYSSSKMNKAYRKPVTKKVGKNGRVEITVDISQYRVYYPVIYAQKNNVISRKVTNRTGEIKR